MDNNLVKLDELFKEIMLDPRQELKKLEDQISQLSEAVSSIDGKVDSTTESLLERIDEIRQTIKNLTLQKGDKGDTVVGPPGPRGPKGETTIVEKVIEVQKTEVIKEIPIVTENVVEVAKKDTPQELLQKLELLVPDLLELLKIEELEKKLNEKIATLPTRGIGGVPGLLTYVEGAKKGFLKGVNFIGATHSIVNGLDTLTFSGSGGGTAVYGEAVSFSDSTGILANTPIAGTVRLYRGGIRQLEDISEDYTISGDTITLTIDASSGEVFLADYLY